MTNLRICESACSWLRELVWKLWNSGELQLLKKTASNILSKMGIRFMFVLAAAMSVMLLATSNGQRLLTFGDSCSLDDNTRVCDSSAGLNCQNEECVCAQSDLVFFEERGACLAPVGASCYLDGSVSCVHNAGCTDNVFDGSGHCACVSDYSPVAAKDCDSQDVHADGDGNSYPTICCPNNSK